MSQREEKISKLLEFPYDAFLMLRLEYVQILNDELEAKLLRIIEKYIEQERKSIYQKMLNTAGTPPNETVEIARDIWVPISYRLFMNDLFGLVTSENTIKKALKRMADKKIIFTRFEPKKKYDAPEYKIRTDVLQMLLNVLKIPGYQSLIPSIVDTLKSLSPQAVIPSEYQLLIPSKSDSSSNSELRVSKFDTTITEDYDNNRDTITENNGDFASAQSHPSLAHDIENALDEEDDPDATIRRQTPASLQAIGATHETTEHPPVPATPLPGLEICSPLSPVTREDAETHVAIATTLGEPDFPPSVLSRQSHTPFSSSPTDGAAAEDHSGPRPSWMQEDEPQIKPETKAERKRRIEQREREIWALVEAGLRTKFTRTHRQLKANTTGMERLIEDDTKDETIKTGLEKLSDFWKNQFDLAMFHAKLPGLVREQTPQQIRKLADKSPQNVRDVQYEAALQKIGKPLDEEVPAWLDFDNYVGNGPEERKRWREEGDRLKAQGFCPDL